jgi:hypothetical protein
MPRERSGARGRTRGLRGRHRACVAGLGFSRCSQDLLEQDKVSPRASQLTDLGHTAGLVKPSARMEAQRAVIFGVDASDHDVGAPGSQCRFHRVEQRTPHTARAYVLANVNGVLPAGSSRQMVNEVCMTSL